ncbi:hypothetical protein CV103_13825, partial [Sphingomonas fennica]
MAIYFKAKIHWWDKGASKATLSNPVDSSVIVGACVELINRRSDEQWLIIYHKDAFESRYEGGLSIIDDMKQRRLSRAGTHNHHVMAAARWMLPRKTSARRS